MSALDFNDKTALKHALTVWYGPQANDWMITDALVIQIIKMVDEMGSCSMAMNYVPKPSYFSSSLTGPAIEYAKRLIREVSGNAAVYKACAATVLNGYRTEIQILGSGG
jgi:hypothetical protein